MVEFSFISPEVAVASIGPDLCVFPVTEELRSRIGMEALRRLSGVLCVCLTIPDTTHGTTGEIYQG